MYPASAQDSSLIKVNSEIIKFMFPFPFLMEEIYTHYNAISKTGRNIVRGSIQKVTLVLFSFQCANHMVIPQVTLVLY